MPKCVTHVLGLQNTGTNLVENIVEASGCDVLFRTSKEKDAPHITRWKHNLLHVSDGERFLHQDPDLTHILVTTRHPYCWTKGMTKSPYEAAGHVSTKEEFRVDASKQKYHGALSWRADHAGDAWNRYMRSAEAFCTTLGNRCTFVPYESLLEEKHALATFQQRFPPAEGLSPRDFQQILDRPAKSHGKPRSLQNAREAVRRACMHELTPDQINDLRNTVDADLAGRFGYSLV